MVDVDGGGCGSLGGVGVAASGRRQGTGRSEELTFVAIGATMRGDANRDHQGFLKVRMLELPHIASVSWSQVPADGTGCKRLRKVNGLDIRDNALYCRHELVSSWLRYNQSSTDSGRNKLIC